MTIFRRRLAITTAVVVLLGLASVAPQCSNTTGLVVAQDRTPTKHRVPAPERQTAILKLLDETYGLSKASTLPKKKQVAEALMGLASLPETEQDERYVVFLTALPLLREVGDFAPYSAALDQLLVAFAVDADAIQTKYLSEFMADCKASSKLEPVVQEAVACTGHLAREHKFSQAKQLQDSAEAQAKKLSAAKLVKSLAEIRVLLTDHEKSFIAQEQAQKRLATTPDDSASNFARWRYSKLAGNWRFQTLNNVAIPNGKVRLRLMPRRSPISNRTRQRAMPGGRWRSRQLVSLSLVRYFDLNIGMACTNAMPKARSPRHGFRNARKSSLR
jgi:hypothetical protein